jgi:hypothetical protein
MNRFPIALALYPWLAISAFCQTPLPPPQQALPQVRQYLSLTDDQVTAILKTNSDYNTFSFEQQRQIQQAESQIAAETAKDPLDPVALGTLYAQIETTCRGLRDKAAAAQQQNISVLTDVQKAKLNMLNDTVKLAPIISEAQSDNYHWLPCDLRLWRSRRLYLPKRRFQFDATSERKRHSTEPQCWRIARSGEQTICRQRQSPFFLTPERMVHRNAT